MRASTAIARPSAATLGLALLALAGCGRAQAQREPVVGLPCEGCEAVFDGLPARIAPRTRLAPDSEPGEAMVISGQVLDAGGRPRPGIVVYAYQTNARGVYPDAPAIRNPETRRHGALRGWARSDGSGRYAFDSIRPGSYPDDDVPAHVHLHVIEPGCATYYIDDIMFTDDPKLTPAQVRRLARNRGGNGIVTPLRQAGTWHVRRDIHLGSNIPGYRACSQAATPPAADLHGNTARNP